MNTRTHCQLPLPIHPEDFGKPISTLNFTLPSGKLVQLVVPIQGEKTLENAIQILNIWKPTLVLLPEDDYQI